MQKVERSIKKNIEINIDTEAIAETEVEVDQGVMVEVEEETEIKKTEIAPVLTAVTAKTEIEDIVAKKTKQVRKKEVTVPVVVEVNQGVMAEVEEGVEEENIAKAVELKKEVVVVVVVVVVEEEVVVVVVIVIEERNIEIKIEQPKKRDITVKKEERVRKKLWKDIQVQKQ